MRRQTDQSEQIFMYSCTSRPTLNPGKTAVWLRWGIENSAMELGGCSSDATNCILVRTSRQCRTQGCLSICFLKEMTLEA